MRRLTAAAALAAWSALPAAAQEIRVGDLKAHLFLEGSGKLSEDVLAMRDPKLFNLPRGEGVFGEPANTVIVAVTLLGARNTQPKHATALVNVTTTNRAGQRRTEAKPLMGFVFGEEGRVSRLVALENVTCSKVEIEVKARVGSRRAVLDFECKDPPAAEATAPRATQRR